MQDGNKHRFPLKNDIKHSLETRVSSLYAFEICLSVETFLWRQRTSCNVLSNVAGFHDVISVINVQNFYQKWLVAY